MIDVTTSDHHGHWDVEDIKRLCEYRDRIKQARLTWALSCPCDCSACVELDWAIRGHPPQAEEHAGG